MAHEPGLDVAAPVAEIERRIRWPVIAVAIFLAIMLGLLAVALFPVLSPPRSLEGLPDDPDVAAARAALRGIDPAAAAGLRFHSALFDDDAGRLPTPADLAAIAAARGWIERAHTRGGDPRLPVFLAHLDLAAAQASRPAAGDPDAGAANARLWWRAERTYHQATDGHDHVPEARLGLGILYALEAGAARDPARARALELQAIAQLAAVSPHDQAGAVALYDRALLLAEVGRRAEASDLARAYLARDTSRVWAARLQEALGAAR